MGREIKSKEEKSKNGRQKTKRSCTDVIILFLFIVFTVGMAFVSAWSFMNGNAYMLLYGTDSWGNVCSRPAPQKLDANISATVPLYGRNMVNLSKVYYFDMKKLDDSIRVCVSECPSPNATQLTTPGEMENYAKESGIHFCRYDVPVEKYSTTVNGKLCPSQVPNHFTVLNRCVPEIAVTAGKVALDTVGNTLSGALSALQATCSSEGTFFDMAGSDIEKTWREILYLCAIGFGAALLMTLVLRFLAFIAIWFIVIVTGLGSLAVAGYCWYQWYLMKQELDNADETMTDVKQLQDRVKSWIIYASIATVVALIVILILVIMRKRIALVAQLFKETGKVIAAVPSLLLQPFMTVIILMITVTCLIISAVFMVTTDYPVATKDGTVEWRPMKLYEYVRWPYLLGAFWYVQFVFACHELVIAGVVGIWYFSRNKRENGSPLCHSIARLIRYHLGSAAFGALIIAIIQFIRAILAFVQKQMYGKTNKLAQYIMKAVQLCMWCFEKLIKFINRNAYIMVAIKGHNFCSGAKAAFFILLENILRVAAVNSLGSFCLFLAKIAVTVGVFAIGMNFFQKREDICYTWLPNLIGAMFAFLITHIFLSLYAMCIDTILLCFCIDCNENDGVDSPFYMSKSLMAFVNNNKKNMKKKDESVDIKTS